jgi:hypothetical protein
MYQGTMHNPDTWALLRRPREYLHGPCFLAMSRLFGRRLRVVAHETEGDRTEYYHFSIPFAKSREDKAEQ